MCVGSGYLGHLGNHSSWARGFLEVCRAGSLNLISEAGYWLAVNVSHRRQPISCRQGLTLSSVARSRELDEFTYQYWCSLRSSNQVGGWTGQQGGRRGVLGVSCGTLKTLHLRNCSIPYLGFLLLGAIKWKVFGGAPGTQ